MVNLKQRTHNKIRNDNRENESSVQLTSEKHFLNDRIYILIIENETKYMAIKGKQ